ncbi:MAG: hypothetical protein PHU42_02315 [Patescibacteria group bacterium]|nr:hypothetical protein [Patescibacteria group bacterium]
MRRIISVLLGNKGAGSGQRLDTSFLDKYTRGIDPSQLRIRWLPNGREQVTAGVKMRYLR